MGYIGVYICICISTGIHKDMQVIELYMDTWGLFRVIKLYRGTLGYTGEEWIAKPKKQMENQTLS